jgi:DNA-dependent protein kinase catalytic subunit
MGIGDRHRSNTLIDVTTGEVVGIDFGHAFGSATMFLGVPELMPFRLTPQLQRVFHPHDTSGWFRLGMLHSLTVLGRNREDILAVLQVFVEDPLVEWTDRANKDNAKYGGGGSSSSAGTCAAASFCSCVAQLCLYVSIRALLFSMYP